MIINNLLSVLLTGFICTNGGESRSTLKMVHLVYRHGARSPVVFYPTDPHINDWPDGAGRLTQIGMNLEFHLGKFLKERYIVNNSFVNQLYLHNEVYIRSSNSERCLESAEAQLAGLYPPVGRQVWNEKLAWQPVPIHTVPGDKDPILRPDEVLCPKRDKKYLEFENTLIYKKKKKESQELVSYLSTHAGMNVTFENMYIFSDGYICQKTQNLSTPAWLLSRIDEVIDFSTWLFLYRYSGDDEMGKLLGGNFLYQIINNMEQMSKGENMDNLFKLNIFSGHDTSLLSLCTALDIEITVPTFASCILLELYEDYSNDYYVEMRYRNDSSGRTYPLKLKKCQFSCPLDTFVSLTASRVTANLAKECQLSNKAKESPLIKVILAVIVTLLLLPLLLIMRYYLCKKVRATKLQINVEEMSHFLDEDENESSK